jgi:hypothetical protein
VPHKLVTFVRHNAIALLALFVALGGTSYAALNLPANSVGSKQIRNRSITPVKLDPSSIAASVKAWAIVYGDATSATAGPSSSRVHVQSLADGESITWLHQRFSSKCLPMATALGPVQSGGYGAVTVTDFRASVGQLYVQGFGPDKTGRPQPAYVVIVCP